MTDDVPPPVPPPTGPIPSTAPIPSTSRSIGKDEWVEQAAARRSTGLVEDWRRWLAAIPVHRRVLAVGASALLFALVSPTDYTTHIGVTVAIYTVLACGLNVVVGWAGLLDLSYVAFFGFGAYAYGLLSSDKFNLHWPTVVSVPVVVVGTSALGFLIGLPSRRLSGDYLAIVTLFFGQIFVSLVHNGNRLQLNLAGHNLPAGQGFDLTGGPNGVVGIDNYSLFALHVRSEVAHYVLATIVATIVVLLMYRLRNSRTGLALRAMREDPLASEILSIPTRRLRLVAFALGAGIAGLAGTIFASLQKSVFDTNFALPALVLLYAAVILGGLGNVGGGLIGAIIVVVLPEMLRTPSTGRFLMYGALVAFVAWRLRPWNRLGQFLAGLIGAAALVRAGLAISGTDLRPRSAGLAKVGGTLVPHLVDSVKFGNVAFLSTIFCGLGLTLLPTKWKPVAGGIVAYLGMLAWENRLADQGSITRQLLIGASLVAIMASRPQGIFGTRRVEVL